MRVRAEPDPNLMSWGCTTDCARSSRCLSLLLLVPSTGDGRDSIIYDETAAGWLAVCLRRRAGQTGKAGASPVGMVPLRGGCCRNQQTRRRRRRALGVSH